MKDYARKPYMGTSYYEFTRRPTRKHLQNIKLQKESEFEKPYRKDEYPEMQHFAPSSEPPPWTLPGWETPGTPGVPTPETPSGSWPPASPYPPGPPGDPGSPYPPGPPWWPDEDPPRPNLRCPPNMECSPRNSKQVATDGCGLVFVGGMCGRHIVATLLPISDPGFKIRGSGNNFSCEHCQPSFFVNVCYEGTDPDARAYIEFVDIQFSDIRLAYIICIIKANCCTLATQISYSSGNPATIGQSTEAAITVDDGCGPFSWSVSGTGFSFAQPNTTSRSNTLITDGSACGTATITVTDECGDTATGYVRNTTGVWVEKSTSTCELSGVGTEVDTGGTWYDYEYIVGNKRQLQRTVHVQTNNLEGPCSTGYCDDLCGDPWECTDCIGDGEHPVPCEENASEATPLSIICWKVGSLNYYEWECA